MILRGAALVSSLMAVLWFVQKRKENAGIVDVGWAAGLGLLALLYAAMGEGDPSRRVLLAALAGLWSLRLAGYLFFDRFLGKPEDGRYQRLRAYWKDGLQLKFFLFFQAQALLDLLLAIPFYVICNDLRPLGGRDALAGGIWLTAVLGESVADRQLARFRADAAHHGKTCRDGLWRYSRHPNYFFEWLHWWAYVAMAPLAVAGAWTLLGPAVMLFFLYKVTGIPATEAHALASRGEDYRDYQRTTSAFIPWFPKESR